MSDFQLHVLSTGGQPPDQWIEIAGYVHNAMDYFHIREKRATASQLLEWVDLLLKQGVPADKIVINDRVDVALARSLSVQLAYHSLPVNEVKKLNSGIRSGVSIHSQKEAMQAAALGADLVFFGHIYETDSKPGLPPKGTEALLPTVKACSVPVIAIGGIKPHHVPLIKKTGAAGIAVQSGIMNAKDPLEAITAYRKGGFS
ncbi:thiamine phosphate synthase [Jeotgalibacillus campisalis]|uniref:Thiamine-phosphate diphosphorylase n=1 Tax=Jeotgalibacillus campisalis TaxID=220754 RepID=A0A0C2SAC0_9BACL|nr:thiamine phosphate synthase [Jeotgalibacillus campisalis]KIL50909.1 thiamine-phosphate diphosphorylase [Jeotgalibacillus campisalis]